MVTDRDCFSKKGKYRDLPRVGFQDSGGSKGGLNLKCRLKTPANAPPSRNFSWVVEVKAKCCSSPGLTKKEI